MKDSIHYSCESCETILIQRCEDLRARPTSLRGMHNIITVAALPRPRCRLCSTAASAQPLCEFAAQRLLLPWKNHPWPLTSASILLFFFFCCTLVRPKWFVFLNQSSAGGAVVFLKHLICSYGPLMEGQQKARKPNRIKSLSQEQRASVARYKYTLTSHTHAHTHKRHGQRSHRTQAPFTIISSVRTKESLW